MERRNFLLAAAGSAVAVDTLLSAAAPDTAEPRLHIALNSFAANVLYTRDKANYLDNLAELKDAGIDGIELSLNTANDLQKTVQRLNDAGMQYRSVYTSANLHDEAAAGKEIDRLVQLGSKMKELGSRFICFNAAAKHGKSDAELIRQSQNIDKTGKELAALGITLALHYHTTELEFGGREFVHILNGTDPKHLTLCLEEHWSYRGCGNSQVALFDHLKLYADRVSMVHLRQSSANVWSESFGDGDIDNVKLSAELKRLNRPLLFVLEQCSESGTPKTLTAKELFRRSAEYVRKVF
ncbi:MAG: sugar phosphate isomerase/epimerase [Planctomycetaceae bacterium]|jgi:inosose dehydratase|nr:sugar phosphate isomerase/epimerase [Planctomycetaceae bacterium]